MESTSGTSGYSGFSATNEVSDNTTSKPRKKRTAKALVDAECKTCKKYGWDEKELTDKIKSLSATYSVNQVASMLRIHSQYVKEVLSK